MKKIIKLITIILLLGIVFSSSISKASATGHYITTTTPGYYATVAKPGYYTTVTEPRFIKCCYQIVKYQDGTTTVVAVLPGEHPWLNLYPKTAKITYQTCWYPATTKAVWHPDTFSKVWHPAVTHKVWVAGN